jgi:hypothetical protein
MERLAVRGQRQAGLAAQKQVRSQLGLDRGDLAADRRLQHVELDGGRREAQVAGRRLEGR